MGSTNKADWDGVSITEDNEIVAEGGFVGNLGGDPIIVGGSSTTTTRIEGTFVNLGGETTGTVQFNGAGATQVIIMGDLPLSDPGVLGQLWQNGLVMNISAG